MRPTVLVVEDNPVNMELVTDLLECRGLSVLQASDAEQGILLAVTHQPDIILMDVALPGMDGLEATRILRQDSRTQIIPVLALTAHAMSGDAAKAMAAGCVGYLAKPINTRLFAATVLQFIESERPLQPSA